MNLDVRRCGRVGGSLSEERKISAGIGAGVIEKHVLAGSALTLYWSMSGAVIPSSIPAYT